LTPPEIDKQHDYSIFDARRYRGDRSVPEDADLCACHLFITAAILAWPFLSMLSLRGFALALLFIAGVLVSVLLHRAVTA
jgi:hypothetical protein